MNMYIVAKYKDNRSSQIKINLIVVLLSILLTIYPFTKVISQQIKEFAGVEEINDTFYLIPELNKSIFNNKQLQSLIKLREPSLLDLGIIL